MRCFAPLALVLFGLLMTARAEAQVIIQGQVTYGAPNAPAGNYAQPTDPNLYQGSAYTQPVSQPQPVRYEHRSAAIPAVIVPGIVLLVGGYVSQAIGAPMLAGQWDDPDQLGFAYVPILGPWLQLGAFRNLDTAFESAIGYFSVVTGIAQALGLVLTIVGLTVREEWDEPVYALSDDPTGPTLAFDGTSATLSF
jgi:hypothetical protein